ncbi:MAG: CBS domain-containing protein [Candidatus Latescibacterota bacterium]|nr:MAG: CBS domain-containing protein [Candidatus Latescibacterota bacterium]
MQVQHLMTQDVVTVREDTSLNEVARCMSEKGISGVPVLDAEGQLVGIITELDMIARNARLEVPVFLQILDASIPLELPSHLRERLQHMLGTEARDVMTEKVHTVTQDTELEDLVDLMLKKRVNPVPVMQDERLVGIVSRSDLVRMMAAKLK